MDVEAIKESLTRKTFTKCNADDTEGNASDIETDFIKMSIDWVWKW